jgi:1-phosphatidylinositol-3-phosphate 5-kinase
MAMEKYILQAPNCWHQFSGRVVGVGVPRRTVMLTPAGMAAAQVGKLAKRTSGQVLEVEDGEQEKAAGSMI